MKLVQTIYKMRDQAVTPVIATVLIVSVVLSVSAATLFWGIPYVQRAQAESQQRGMYSQMMIFAESLNSLSKESLGSTKVNKFSMQVGEIKTENRNCKIITYYSRDDDYKFNVDGLSDNDNKFMLGMEKGGCNKVKVYYYGTRTAYSRFNPPEKVKEVSSHPQYEGYFNLTISYNLSNSNASAFYTTKGYEEPLSIYDSRYKPYSTELRENISTYTNYNTWFGDPGDESQPDGYYVNIYYMLPITKDVGNISRVNLTWVGKDTLSGGGTFGIYMWNFSKSDWDLMKKVYEKMQSDEFFYFNISKNNLKSFIFSSNGNNYVIVGISGGKGGGLPNVITLDAVAGSTTAILRGDLLSLGSGSDSCDVWFEYGTTSGSYNYITQTETRTDTGMFSRSISGLSPGTTYYYRAVARNDAGTVYGNERSFTTYKLPYVVTQDAENVGTKTAILKGYLKDPGIPSNTCRVWFEYGTTPGSYTEKTEPVYQSTEGLFSADVSGLSPGTTYYFRAIAENDAGTVFGEEKSFKTLSGMCCFPEGTRITMADGSLKGIEEIKIGDEVLSYDTSSGRFTTSRVMDIIITERDVYRINGDLIMPTDDHPFYVMKRDGTRCWAAIDPKKASEAYPGIEISLLEIGDQMFIAAQGGRRILWLEITSIEYAGGPLKTYTLYLNSTGTPADTYLANDILVHAGGCFPSYCFPEGTKITLADGSVKNIEKIKVGDAVISYNDGKTFESRVERILTSKGRIYSINQGVIYLTEGHPIYVRKIDGTLCWASINPRSSTLYGQDVKYLDVGDEMFTDKGWIQINSIERTEEVIKVYTLDLENADSFFANGILVKSLNEGHTLYERYVEITIYGTFYDKYPPKTYIENIDNLPYTYYSPSFINISWYAVDPDGITEDNDFVYKYRLDPLDKSWKPGGSDLDIVTKNNSISFKPEDFGLTYFPRGEYIFRVRAMDLSGKWDLDETIYNSYKFNVEPKIEEKIIDVHANQERTIDLSEPLVNDFLLIELINNSDVFGRVWIMNFTSLDYALHTGVGTYGVSFENGALIYNSPGGKTIKSPPFTFLENGRLAMHFMQLTLPESFTISGNSVITLSSILTDNKILEQREVYYLTIQVSGESEGPWKEYLEKFCGFVKVRDKLVYREDDVDLILVHTIVESRKL